MDIFFPDDFRQYGNGSPRRFNAFVVPVYVVFVFGVMIVNVDFQVILFQKPGKLADSVFLLRVHKHQPFNALEIDIF